VSTLVVAHCEKCTKRDRRKKDILLVVDTAEGPVLEWDTERVGTVADERNRELARFGYSEAVRVPLPASGCPLFEPGPSCQEHGPLRLDDAPVVLLHQAVVKSRAENRVQHVAI
jgi:hypothetical protein